MDHINTALVENKRPMMYKMMKWWGGKPHNIWAEYIKKYTESNDVVLDPFCGRGVGVAESVRNGRKAIGIDLNPIAIFQAKMILKPLDISKFNKEWNKIKKDLDKYEKGSNFFATLCIRCGNNARLVTVNRVDDIPYTIFYKCSCVKKYQEKSLDQNDKKAISISNVHDIKFQYPKQKFPHTAAFDMARRNYGETYEELFTRRNLFALAVIFNRINKVDDIVLKDFFKFAFISMVHLVSSIPSVREHSGRVGSGSWGRPSYMKPKKNMELNPFLQFERAIEGNQGIIKGKINSNERLMDKVKFAKTVQDLNFDSTVLLSQTNALEMVNFLKDNSIDYVITDPPYGGLIAYFDLSFIWSAWLALVDDRFTIPFDDEITIDSHKKIDFEEYHRRLDLVFDQIFRVLKGGKYMTVTFHNSKPKIFNSILKACQNSGFVLEKILFQMNRRAGETGAVSPWGTSVSDFYIRFRKPKKDESVTKLTDFVEIKFESIVERIAKEVLSQRGEPTEIAAMIPHMYEEMGQSGMRIHFSSDNQISTILDKSKDFIKIKNELWWFTDSVIKKSKLSIPLSDRVEEAVLNVLRQNYKVTYDQVLGSIFEKFPNSLTPDTENVGYYLNEYGEKTSDGMWKLKLGMNESEILSKHTSIETVLMKIGVKFGYDVWSPDKSKNSEMSNICIDFDLDSIPNSDRIKLIDVLWMKEGKIKYAFEVENSTGITTALERGSNISSHEVKRIIVLPNERMKFFERKKTEPLFSDYFKKDKWQIILYDRLESFIKNESMTEDSFTKLFKKS